MAGRIDGHTSTLLGEGMDWRRALGFHLEARCWPPASHLQGVCERAIEAVNGGRPEKPIRLNDALTVGRCERVTWRGMGTAPAMAVVEGFNLWCFIDEEQEVTA